MPFKKVKTREALSVRRGEAVSIVENYWRSTPGSFRQHEAADAIVAMHWVTSNRARPRPYRRLIARPHPFQNKGCRPKNLFESKSPIVQPTVVFEGTPAVPHEPVAKYVAGEIW